MSRRGRCKNDCWNSAIGAAAAASLLVGIHRKAFHREVWQIVVDQVLATSAC